MLATTTYKRVNL